MVRAQELLGLLCNQPVAFQEASNMLRDIFSSVILLIPPSASTAASLPPKGFHVLGTQPRAVCTGMHEHFLGLPFFRGQPAGLGGIGMIIN